ncbi:MAG: MFS transporter [Candidatus Rokubacteria bacterium]|nr:MFS transporter [Candidatus Rokubacteria bacterium]
MTDAGGREPLGAWTIVAVIFLAQAVTAGVRSTIGLLIRPWETEFGWERAAISLTASVGFVVYGLAQALCGRWADRTGPRIIFAVSLVLVGAGTVAVGSIVTLWQAYLVFGVLIMVGVGGASSPTAAAAIARWFTRRRGLALGIVAGGSAAGQFVLLPVMAVLVQGIGWRLAFAGLGAGILLVTLPVVLVLLKDDPAGVAPRRATRAAADGKPLPVPEIARHANFWRLALSFFVCGVTTAGLIDPHLIPYAEDHHISTVTAATAFGVLSLVNTVFTMVSGAVGDRWGHRRLLGWIYAGRAATLVLLLFARDPVLLFVFAVAFGIVDFSTVAPTTTLSTVLFGRRSAGTVYGLVALSHQIGSAAGSYAGGVIHDLTGSYSAFFIAAAVLSSAAAAMAWTIAEERVVGRAAATPA